MSMSLLTGLSIDSLVFDNQNFILQEIHGIESPTLRLPRYNLPGANGTAVSNALFAERAISIKGYVNAPDGTPSSLAQSVYLANRRTLINSVAYKRDVNGNLFSQLMTITLMDGTQVTCNVFLDKPLQMGFSIGNTSYEEFQLTFIAPDPNLYSTIQNVTNIGLAVGGGVAVPTAVPLSLASSSGGQAIITNVGTNVAFPVITLVGPLTNPFIANLTTNQYMQLNMVINATDAPVIINMGAPSIMQNGGDISANRTTFSTYWGLFGGNNTIGFSASAGSGTATVGFYPSYAGI